MKRMIGVLALCLTACQLAACAESFVPVERPVGPAAKRTTAVPTQLSSGGRVDRPASTLILGLN